MKVGLFLVTEDGQEYLCSPGWAGDYCKKISQIVHGVGCVFLWGKGTNPFLNTGLCLVTEEGMSVHALLGGLAITVKRVISK